MSDRQWLKWLVIAVILIVLLIDQSLKFWVKTTFRLGESREIFPWFHLYFIENPGMAFGIHWPGRGGKLALSALRVVMTAVFIYLLVRLLKQGANVVMVLGVSLIVGGAIGNLIDTIFYGVLFSESTYWEPARFLPEDGGYAPLFYGKVVDMLYLPLFDIWLPEWIPLIGGTKFTFFAPVFNVADTAITLGFVLWLVGQFIGVRKE